MVCRQRPSTTKGHAFLTLEDETGLASVIVRPQVYEAQRQTVRGEPLVIMQGAVSHDQHATSLLGQRFQPLDRPPPPPMCPPGTSTRLISPARKENPMDRPKANHKFIEELERHARDFEEHLARPDSGYGYRTVQTKSRGVNWLVRWLKGEDIRKGRTGR